MGKGDATRQRMVDGAWELVRRDGYAATSMRDVWEHSGTPRGSAYFHFPEGKEELGLAVVDQQSQVWLGLIDAVARRTRAPGPFLRGLARGIADELEGTGWQLGCAVAAVATEMSASAGPLGAAAADAYRSWTAAIARALRAKGVAARRAESIAPGALAALVGALTVSRVSRDRTTLERTGAMLASMVSS